MSANKSPIVWVIKEQSKRGDSGSSIMDYTPAMKYGEIKFITDFDLPTHQASSAAESWQKAAARFVVEVDFDRDYLILTGAPLAIFTIGLLIGATNKFPRILVWKREQGIYVPFQS